MKFKIAVFAASLSLLCAASSGPASAGSTGGYPYQYGFLFQSPADSYPTADYATFFISTSLPATPSGTLVDSLYGGAVFPSLYVSGYISLAPTGTLGSDNLIYSTGPYIDSSGISFYVGPYPGSEEYVFVLTDPTITEGNCATNCVISGGTLDPTPLPAALPLFATGLGALGLLGWRRKRKNAAIAA